MQGKKTHDQHLRTLERKPDVPAAHRSDSQKQGDAVAGHARSARADGRQSEFPISRGGMNQESDHNKHNHPTQPGHKPVKPEPAQEKRG